MYEILALVTAIVVASAPTVTHAQPRYTAGYTQREVKLARLCWFEAEHTYDGDCAAIHASVAEKARLRGWSWERMARAYASRVLGHRRHLLRSRHFIAHLRGDLRRPRYWPRNSWRGPWDGPGGVRAWHRRLENARAIWSGYGAYGCTTLPTDWGTRGSELVRRKLRNGIMYRVDCGDTRNVFLRLRSADSMCHGDGRFH